MIILYLYRPRERFTPFSRYQNEKAGKNYGGKHSQNDNSCGNREENGENDPSET